MAPSFIIKVGKCLLFVDMTIFRTEPPAWIKIVEKVNWSKRGLNGTFGSLVSLNIKAANKSQFKGMRDAFEIAELLLHLPR